MFKTDGMNFEKGHICSEHWSGGVRENPEHLPDIIVPKSQLRKLKQKLHNASKKIKQNSSKEARAKVRELQKKQ